VEVCGFRERGQRNCSLQRRATATPKRNHRKGKTIKPKARHTARYGYAAPLLLPPNLRVVAGLPFSLEDFSALDAWLAEPGWPDNHMDVATLEGYLAALLTWPIELAPGAWLPPIWGIRGWKVAAKIAAPETYDRFIALVIGLFQELERRLVASPPTRTFVLGRDAPNKSGRYFAGAAWATGFMTALHENSAGLGSRSSAVRSAVEDIARYASLRSLEPSALPAAATALSVAVMIIMSERPTRGSVTAAPKNKARLLETTAKIAAKRELESIVDDVSERDKVTTETVERQGLSVLESGPPEPLRTHPRRGDE
jgi:yecA family protein